VAATATAKTEDNKDHGRRPVTRRREREKKWERELGEGREEEERLGSGVGRIREGRLGTPTEG
jgi:hypothetical protein